MGGRGKRRPNNRNNDNNNNSSGGGGSRSRSKNRGKSRAGEFASTRIRNSLFVEGGVLSDWSVSSSYPPGTNVKKNGKTASGTGSSNPTRGASASKSAPRKSIGNSFGYAYPSVEIQDALGSRLSAEDKNRKKNSDESRPIVLVDSKESPIIAFLDKSPALNPHNVDFTYTYGSSSVLGDTSHRGLGFLSAEDKNKEKFSDDLQPIVLCDSKESPIVAFLDESPTLKTHNVDFTYNYGSSSVLGGTSHRGLGFYDEYEANASCIASSSKQMEKEEKEVPCFYPSSSGEEMDADETISHVVGGETTESMYDATYTPKRNSAFVSIGGMKLFTQDISDEETDGDVDGESIDDDSSGSSEDSESDDSEDTSSSDLDIDEAVAEDYLEGIGGSSKILDAKWLEKRNLDNPDEDSSSSGSFDQTVKKLGGIALQDASREYGMNPKSKKKSQVDSSEIWSSALDELMFVKDPRTRSGKKKQGARLPRSWPSEAQKSKGSRKLPGMKKKHRKEGIADKRRERMRRRGVHLEKINTILEQIVLDGVDVFHFDPMHYRDCSQVRRLAAIYRLHSGCKGCGKLSFVTVTRTKDTCVPSAADKIRLEKLIGAGDEDSDFGVVESSNSKSASADRNRKKKSAKGSGGKRASFADKPVSFISSGLMESETAESSIVDYKETDANLNTSAKVGAFELHTKGFGSKMMAKMGFVEGGGLGKDGQGMAEPIQAVQRPKSLGLGVDFSNTSPGTDSVKNPDSNRTTKKHVKTQSFGAFEKHTRGFGSKMMARMGFVEGTGLGKDSQGITNPLFAVRLPKSRGLGANV